MGVDFTGNGICVKTGDMDLTACMLHFLLVGRLILEHGSECEMVNRVRAATLGSVLISIHFCVRQKPIMNC